MDVRTILNNIGYLDLKDFGREWRAKPLYRDSDNSSVLSVNKITGKWYDFSARRGGGLNELIQMTLNLPANANIDAYLAGQTFTHEPLVHQFDLETVFQFDKKLLFKLQPDHSYWTNRKISELTVKIFQGGVTYNGKMSYRYVFPIFDERDNIIGFSGRMLKENPDFSKWKHIGSKTNWIYPFKWNAHEISALKEVILLESIGDMLSLWDKGVKNTLVLFGVTMSSKIIQTLIKMDVRKIHICLNNDSNKQSVGNKAAYEIQNQLRSFFDPNQIQIALPESKDFGEMNLSQIDLWKHHYRIKN
jgi:hypothetical protein